MEARKPALIVIAGPTAVGKTALAIAVAQELNTEILSADSRQCYQGMSIGTAQPTREERESVPHHFIDAYPVTQAISAADYEHIGLQTLEGIFARKHVAVACGGTGLYIKALCEGLDDMPQTDPLQEQLVSLLYREYGLPALQEATQREDPLFYASGEMHNPARLIRALSFIRSCGRSIMDFRTGQKKERPFRIIKTALELPRELLYTRINLRVQQMMQQGLEQEASRLYDYRQLKNLNTVGYSELFDYLDGKISLDQATALIAQHSRNYAKRQMTWFKKDKAFIWFRADNPDTAARIAQLARE